MHQAEIIVVLFAAGRADIQAYRAEAPLPPGHICNAGRARLPIRIVLHRRPMSAYPEISGLWT
jgi:hypothetical protein